MKKKLLTLFLVCAMLFSMAIVANAGTDVTGADAVAAASKNAVVIDVRTPENYAKGNLAGSYNWPLFDANGVTNEADALAEAFTTNALAEKTALESKEIYILCNSGARGAKAATNLLKAAGYDENKLHTITNGAKSLQVRYEFLNHNNTVSGADALASIGGNDAVILDVRNNTNYNKGHLALSIHIPVFTETGIVDRADTDELAIAFVNAAKGNAALQGKDIYILCNSGSRGAKAATVLLQDAGYALEDIFTITGGANGMSDKLTATVTEYKFVEGKEAVKAADDTFVIDVRTPENFAKGTIPGAVNWPLFNASGVTNGADALAKEFLAKVEANQALLDGKKIYILCNSGARGAQNATQLLAFAGYNVSTTDAGVVYTIKGGAKDISVRYSFIDPAKINKVEGSEAVAAVGNNEILILDVRTPENFAKGHLKGALSLPVFTANGPVSNTGDELAKAFTDYVNANPETFNKKIYIVCNSGARGAQAATVLLKDAGIPLTNIYTVTGGAGGADVSAAAKYVTGEFAVSKLADKNYLVLDVRAEEKVAALALEGALSVPLFDKDSNLPDDLAEAFIAYVKANPAQFEGKTILVLCNGGARGAAKATTLLAELGYTNVFTIENGAKDAAISNALKQPVVPENKPADTTTDANKAPATGDATPIMIYAIAMVAAAFVIVRRRAFR